MATFGALTFDEKAGEGLFPRFGRRAINTYLRPSGGARVVKQTSGNREDSLQLPAQCTGAQLNSLLNAVDTAATLTWSGGSRYCSLDAVEGPAEFLDSDVCVATLTFTGL